ncbi:MAG: hypothetical protein AAF560_24975 [Acidobacteriota bacterium]
MSETQTIETPRTDNTLEPETIRGQLQAFSEAYQYDASYLEQVFDASPGAFGAFYAAQPMSSYRSALPLDAHYVARVAAMQGQDCGACAQLNLRMAVEAGVDRELLTTLIDDPTSLPAPLRDVHDHALAVTRGDAIDLERAERLRAAYGNEAFAELAVCITGSSIYPTLKRALATALSCEPLRLDF